MLSWLIRLEVMKIVEKDKFKIVKPDRISQRVAGKLKDLILSDDLKPGYKLPSERDLSKMIGVGRLSLREGLRILEAAGIIETRYGIGSGTYISEMTIENMIDRFSECLRLSKMTIDQLTEARMEISSIILKYCIERGDNEDIEKLENCIKETENLFKLGHETREMNIYFHQLIAQSSKNPAFIILHYSLMNMLRQFLSRFVSPPEHSKKVLKDNKRILEYLKKKDLNKAIPAMRSHLTYVKKRMASLIGNNQSILK